MPSLPSGVQRKTIDNAVKLAVQKAAELSNSALGKSIPPAMVKFITMFLTNLIYLAIDNARDGDLDAKGLAKTALKTTIKTMGIVAGANSANIIECGTSLASLALSWKDLKAFNAAAAALATSGVGIPEAGVVELIGATYWSYQIISTVVTCKDAFFLTADEVEQKFPEEYNISSERAMYTNYSDNVCREGQPDPTEL